MKKCTISLSDNRITVIERYNSRGDLKVEKMSTLWNHLPRRRCRMRDLRHQHREYSFAKGQHRRRNTQRPTVEGRRKQTYPAKDSQRIYARTYAKALTFTSRCYNRIYPFALRITPGPRNGKLGFLFWTFLQPNADAFN